MCHYDYRFMLYFPSTAFFDIFKEGIGSRRHDLRRQKVLCNFQTFCGGWATKSRACPCVVHVVHDNW